MSTIIEQVVASIVRIDVANRKVDPKLTNVYYTHDCGRGDVMRPHRIVWETFGLQPGDTIEIQMHCGGMKSRRVNLDAQKATDVLRAGFKGANPAPTILLDAADATKNCLTWIIPSNGQAFVDSGEIILPTDDLDRINAHYEVLLRRPGQPDPIVIDPDVNLIPDP
jgi:hypothetical protein